MTETAITSRDNAIFKRLKKLAENIEQAEARWLELTTQIDALSA